MSGIKETPKKAAPPPIFKLDTTLKLAEAWVSNMSETAADETTDADFESRPPRLGLGAKVPRHSNVGPSYGPLDRKLYAKLEAKKRKKAKIDEERNVLDDDEDDEDLESRTSAFTKRKALLDHYSV